MKRKSILMCLVLVLSLLCIPSAVFAGSINGSEAGLIGQASGTFTYQGQTYVATSSALSQLRAYLSQDGVDLTAEQASRAASLMYSNVEGGVLDGYLTPVGGGSQDQSSSQEDKKTEKKKDEKSQKAGKATVTIKDKESVIQVTGSKGEEVFKASLPVKNTGGSLNGLVLLAAVLTVCLAAAAGAAWKFRLFADSEEREV